MRASCKSKERLTKPPLLPDHQRVPLFTRDHPIELRLRGRQIQGTLIYEKSKELAVRSRPIGQGAVATGNLFESIRDTLNRDLVHASYRRGNYLCTFDAKLLAVEADVSCAEGSVIINLEFPLRVRRRLDAQSQL